MSRTWGLGSGAQASGFWGLGFRPWGQGFGVQGLGRVVEDLGCRVYAIGLGSRLLG